jgi:hypothetical protein
MLPGVYGIGEPDGSGAVVPDVLVAGFLDAVGVVTAALDGAGTGPRRLRERDRDPHSGARILAQPDGDRLFHHPEEVLTPGYFPVLGTLNYALLAFANRYNRTARPFNWKFTADDLTALLHRISQREQAASQQAALSQAA